MPKDATKNIDRYKIRGGQLNEFDFNRNQEQFAEQQHAKRPPMPPKISKPAKSSEPPKISEPAKSSKPPKSSKPAKSTKPAKGATAKNLAARKSAKKLAARKSAKK